MRTASIVSSGVLVVSLLAGCAKMRQWVGLDSGAAPAAGQAPTGRTPAPDHTRPSPAGAQPGGARTGPPVPDPRSSIDITTGITSYPDGTISLHNNAQVGDYARWKTLNGQLTWSVVDSRGDNLLVEMRQDTAVANGSYSIVYLFVCNPEGHLRKVLVGRPGSRARQIPFPRALPPAKPKVLSRSREEITVPQGTYPATRKVVLVDAVKCIVWTSPRVFFDGAVKKAMADGTVIMELTENTSKPKLRPSLRQ